MSNKLNEYLDNPKQAAQTMEEQTVQHLIGIRAQLLPDDHFVDSLEIQLRHKHHQLHQENNKPRWWMAVAVLLIIILASLAIPGARSFAQDSLDKLFNKSDSDVLSKDELVLSPSSTPQKWLEFTTIAKAEEVTQINIHDPAIAPIGFSLESVYISEDLQSATLVYVTSGRFLMISYQPASADIIRLDIGNSAEIIEAQIHDITGEYVIGDWVTDNPAENPDYEWINVESVARRLRWIEDDTFYEIVSRGGSPGHGAYVEMDEIIDLAESLD